MLLLLIAIIVLSGATQPKATSKPAVKPAKLRPLAPNILTSTPPVRVKVETSPDMPTKLETSYAPLVGGKKKVVIGGR